MMVVIQTDSHCALTTPSMTCMPSVTPILFQNSISNLHSPIPLVGNRQNDITMINRQSTWPGVQNFRMAHMTLAHAQTIYHVSPVGH